MQNGATSHSVKVVFDLPIPPSGISHRNPNCHGCGEDSPCQYSMDCNIQPLINCNVCYGRLWTASAFWEWYASFVPQLIAVGLPLHTDWFMQNGATSHRVKVVFDLPIRPSGISHRYPDCHGCGEDSPCQYSMDCNIQPLINCNVCYGRLWTPSAVWEWFVSFVPQLIAVGLPLHTDWFMQNGATSHRVKVGSCRMGRHHTE